MPNSPAHYCANVVNCIKLTTNRYCDDCDKAKKQATSQNRVRDPFYSSRIWRKFRTRYLAGNPWCVWLERDGKPCNRIATDIDHKVARSKGGADFEESNLSAYCKRHHSMKTVRDDGGFGRTA